MRGRFEEVSPPKKLGHKSNRIVGNTGVTPPAQNLTAVDIDAKISFYGTYVQLNEQVTLQNQDPVLNECAARLGVSLRADRRPINKRYVGSDCRIH